MIYAKRLFQKIAKLSAFVAVIVALVVASVMPVLAADSNLDKQQTFYKIASNGSMYFVSTHNPSSDKYGQLNKDNTGKDDSKVLMHNAGTVLGFADTNYDTNIFGAIISQVSSSTQAYSYSGINESTKIGSDPDSGYSGYAHYGLALRELGLDQMTDGGFAGMLNGLWRMLIGASLAISYMLAKSVSMVFKMIFTILRALDPFIGLGDMVHGSNLDELVRNQPNGSNFGFASLLYFAHIIITGVYWVGMYIGIPALIIIFILAKIFAKKTSFTLGNVILRIILGTLLIPICAILYTSGLDGAEQVVDTGLGAADDLIVQNFVDFQGWAFNSNLSLPSGTSIALSNVNDTSTYKGGGSVSFSGYSGKSLPSAQEVTKNINTMLGHGSSGVTDTLDILWSYMSSNTVNSASYESLVSAALPKGKDDRKFLDGLYTDSGKSDAFFNHDGGYKGNESLLGVDSSGNTVSSEYLNEVTRNGNYNNIRMTYSNNNSGTMTFTGDAKSATTPNAIRGLSTIAMYNYLNTSFEDDHMLIYSPVIISSTLTAKHHYAVNLVESTGIARLFLALSVSCALMLMAFIGWGYAGKLAMASAQRMFQMLGHILPAMGMNLKAIIITIGAVAMLVVEWIVTCLILSAVYMLIIGISGAVSGDFGKILVGFAAENKISTDVFAFIKYVILILLYVVILKNAFKWRDTLVKGIQHSIYDPLQRALMGAGVRQEDVRSTAGEIVDNGAATNFACNHPIAGAAMGLGSMKKVLEPSGDQKSGGNDDPKGSNNGGGGDNGGKPVSPNGDSGTPSGSDGGVGIDASNEGVDNGERQRELDARGQDMTSERKDGKDAHDGVKKDLKDTTKAAGTEAVKGTIKGGIKGGAAGAAAGAIAGATKGVKKEATKKATQAAKDVASNTSQASTSEARAKTDNAISGKNVAPTTPDTATSDTPPTTSKRESRRTKKED